MAHASMPLVDQLQDLTCSQLSVLEALYCLSKAYGKPTNKAVRTYYEHREGSGFPFFSGFHHLTGKPQVCQKSVYRKVMELESLGLVKVSRSHFGGKRIDFYTLTGLGRDILKRELLRDKVVSNLPGILDTVQAKFPCKLLTLER